MQSNKRNILFQDEKTLTSDAAMICQRLNIKQDDIIQKPIEAFKKEGMSPQVAKIKFTQNEKQRKAKIKLITSAMIKNFAGQKPKLHSFVNLAISKEERVLKSAKTKS